MMLARRLAETDSPVGELEPRVDPRVYLRDDFAVTLWTYYGAVPPRGFAPAEYAEALERLHAGMRQVVVKVPHFTERVAEAQWLVGHAEMTPELLGPDRDLLRDTLHRFTDAVVDRGAGEQLLHGEPHPGNLLRTEKGLLFVDLETFCHGPSSSTSHTLRRMWARSIRLPIRICCANVESSPLRSPQHGGGIETTNSRTGGNWVRSGSTRSGPSAVTDDARPAAQ